MISPITILGLDPGLATTGWGVVKKENRKIITLGWGIIQTKPEKDVPARLEIISLELGQLLDQFQPQIVTIEELFFGKNVKTAITVGQARGILLLECQRRHLQIEELTPLQVKNITCGYGQADKRQLQLMIQRLLKLKEMPRPDDAADALALAYATAVMQQKFR